MKQKIKKMLLILMLSIGIMGAVSVQAQAQEKVWVKISDIYGHWSDSPKGSIDEICLFSAEVAMRANSYRYEVFYTGKYEIRPNLAPPIKCFVTTKPAWISGVYISPTCKEEGVWSADRPNGCYEERDTCPEGTVNEGGICVAPEVCKDGEVKLDNKCYRVNDSSCDGKQPDAYTMGAASCENSLCYWEIPYIKDWDQKAKDAIRYCTLKHEQSHADDKDAVCDKNGMLGHIDDVKYHESEIKGWNVFLSCIDGDTEDEGEKKDWCKDSSDPETCNAQINKMKELGEIVKENHQLKLNAFKLK